MSSSLGVSRPRVAWLSACLASLSSACGLGHIGLGHDDDAHADCGTTHHGADETRLCFAADTVAAGQTCQSTPQSRMCNDGAWQPDWPVCDHLTCVVEGPAQGQCNNAAGQLFPPTAPWNTPTDTAPLDAESGTIITFLTTNHTAAARFQITFDFNALSADASVAHRPFLPTGDFYDPDCDPAPVPLAAGGRLESESNYACASDGDCHLTVIDWPECRLFEMWRADVSTGAYDSGVFNGGCLAIWDLSQVPPATGRGDFCTSADAAGLPILPLVFNADEIAAGHIDHALRFILPNELIRHFIFVRPGTHSTDSTGGPAAAPPYAARLRLKATANISGLSSAAQVVAAALKKYGMFLADGGNVTFTAATDDLTVHTWSQVGLGPDSLKSLAWSDFEVVELGQRMDWGTGSCERAPITQ